MSRYHSYLNSAKQILQQYNGEEPFANFLKKYFAANKKYGSKDRRQVSNLCYCFFRLGKAVMNVSLEEKLLTALFLCSDQSNEILGALKTEWNDKIHLTIEEKCSIFNIQFSMFNIFPWKEELSGGVDFEKFCNSFFIQPDLFIRIRPGMKESVLKKLSIANCQFSIIGEDCLALPNASKIDSIIELDKEAVIQDYSSQQIGRFLDSALAPPRNDKLSVWDCCAGSGGKSIMAFDLNPEVELTVSDLRESILFNLKKRFEKAGIKKYKTFISDLSAPFLIPNSQFQAIICDAPCTGSGTWSRTPEQLYFFNKMQIEKYAALQKKILSNVIPHLKPGGTFIYITCSVFKKENEENVEFITKNFHLNIKQMSARTTRSDGEVLKGYDKKADSMFVAVFNSPSS